MEILNPQEWRISKSGFSIKTGWGDEKKIIAKYPGALSPIDNAEFQAWMDNAEMICKLHNDSLRALPDKAGEAVAYMDATGDVCSKKAFDSVMAVKPLAEHEYWKRFAIPLYAAPAALPDGYAKKAEMWKECSLRGFPRFNNSQPESKTPWYVYWGGKTFDGATPEDAVTAALAAAQGE